MELQNIRPQYDKRRPHTRWALREIYTGPTGTGSYVPNPDDEVWSWGEGQYRVVSVDYETGLSVLEKNTDKNLSNGLKEEDVLLSSKPGQPADIFRIYVNTSTVPHTCDFDAFLHVYGSQSRYLKIFKGTDISSRGDVISADFNSSGIMTTENIQFEKVTNPQGDILAIKCPRTGYVTDTLTHGEIVTVVIYSAAGRVLSTCKLVTVLSNTVRTVDASKKTITDIQLISPFLNESDNLLLEVPVNMIVSSMPLQVQVVYNDGTSTTYPISDEKVALHGIENFVSSEMGYTADLVLSYTLSEGEFSNLVKTVEERSFITKPYRLRTIDSDNAYQVKLFVLPYWDFPNNEWALKFFMYTLERDLFYDVTPYVEYSTNSTQFNGTLFNATQEINVAVNLSQVHNSYNYYRHPQTFKVTLNQAATNHSTTGYYLLEYSNDSIVGARATALGNEVGNTYTLDISQGLSSGGAILDSLYWNTEPLFYDFAEAKPPAPTHVRVKVGKNWSRTLPVDELTDVMENVDAAPADMRQGTLVQLEWFRQSKTTILELGTVALTLQR